MKLEFYLFSIHCASHQAHKRVSAWLVPTFHLYSKNTTQSNTTKYSHNQPQQS